MSQLSQMSKAQYAYLAAVVVVAIPLLVLASTWNVVSDWYAIKAYRPRLERDLGFHAGFGKHPADASGLTFFIQAVTPNGLFDRAGVKRGDIPIVHHGGAGEFYERLQSYRGTNARVAFRRFIAAPTGEALLIGYEIKLEVPRGAG